MVSRPPWVCPGGCEFWLALLYFSDLSLLKFLVVTDWNFSLFIISLAVALWQMLVAG